jgi:hypothetical protein
MSHGNISVAQNLIANSLLDGIPPSLVIDLISPSAGPARKLVFQWAVGLVVDDSGGI